MLLKNQKKNKLNSVSLHLLWAKKPKPKESVAAGYVFEESDVFNNFASRSLDRNIGNKKSQSRDVSSTTSKEFNSPPSPDFFDEPTLYQKRKTGLSLKKDR